MSNESQAWLSVNKDGTEYIWPVEPERDNFDLPEEDFRLVNEKNLKTMMKHWSGGPEGGVQLPKGSVAKLANCKLTWDDEAFELELD